MNIASLIGAIATIAWVIAIFVVVLVIFQAVRNRPIPKSTTIVVIVLIAATILTSVSAGLVFINPDERGVVISAISPTGYREQELEPGLRWIVPFAESVIRYSISKQTYTMSVVPAEAEVERDDSIEARTSDGQKVTVDASIIFSIDPSKVVFVHITWQNRYATDLIRSVVRGVIRDSVSQYKIEEVYSTKRLEMVSMIDKALDAKLAENGLLLSDFVLRNISFSDEYAASVEQKQIADQQAQQAKFVVEQRKQEADQAREVAKGVKDAAITEAEGQAQARLIQAQAEASALKMITDVLQNNPDLLNYQYITKLSPNVEVMLLPSNSPFIYNLPDMQSGRTSSTFTYVPDIEPTTTP